jgi:chromosome segregation ATPase
LECELWQQDQKLVSTQGKLTTANLEIQRLKLLLETEERDSNYAKRQYEAERRDWAAKNEALRAVLQQTGNGHAAARGSSPRSSPVRAPASRERPSLAVLDEGSLLVEQAGAEAARLRDEVDVLRAALEARGDVGELQSDLMLVRAERVRLALEVHQARTEAATARAAAAEATEAAAAASSEIDAMRDGEAKLREALTEASADLERSAEDNEKLLAEHARLYEHAQTLGESLESTRLERASLREEKLQLMERLNGAEHSAAAMRAELARHDEDFGDVGEVLRSSEARVKTAQAQRDALAAQLGALQEAGKEMAWEMENLQRETHEASSRISELEAELELSRSGTEQAEASEALSEVRADGMAERLEAAAREAVELRAARDRWRAALDEALERCTRSLVEKQLACDDRDAMERLLESEGVLRLMDEA